MAMRFTPGAFPGAVLTSREAGGFRFTETTYTSGQELPTHAHERACFCLVLEGGFEERYGRRSRDGHPHLLIYRPSGEVHTDRFHSMGGRCLNIEIEDSQMEYARRHALTLDDSTDFAGCPTVSLALRLYQEFRLLDSAACLAMEGLALELLSATARRNTLMALRHPPRWLEQAREMLHAHFQDRLDVEAIAV